MCFDVWTIGRTILVYVLHKHSLNWIGLIELNPIELNWIELIELIKLNWIGQEIYRRGAGYCAVSNDDDMNLAPNEQVHLFLVRFQVAQFINRENGMPPISLSRRVLLDWVWMSRVWHLWGWQASRLMCVRTDRGFWPTCARWSVSIRSFYGNLWICVSCIAYYVLCVVFWILRGVYSVLLNISGRVDLRVYRLRDAMVFFCFLVGSSPNGI